jgi:branched-chain amino acid transport system permease protein
MSLDLMVGYCRLYSFGHAAAYGLGAYSTALILTHLALPLPIGIVLAVTATILTAIPIAWICTRSTGVSFAMLTLAFAQLGYAMLFRFRDVTGGSDGIVGIPRPPAVRHDLVPEQDRLLLPLSWAACSAPTLSVPRHRAFAVRRGALRHS